MIQYIFTYIGDDGYEFRDALVMEEAQYNALSPEDLDTLKKARYDAWQANIHVAADKVNITDSDDADVPEDDKVVEL